MALTHDQAMQFERIGRELENGLLSDPAPPPSLAEHLAQRMQYGPRGNDLSRIAAMGADAFIQEQLNPGQIDDAECDWRLSLVPNATLSESVAQLFDRRGASYSSSIQPLVETRHATWIRRIYSKRQLFERLVEFWHDHFNIYAWDFTIRSLWPDWDRLIRQNALGNFRAFLEQTTRHACMLYYLDNYISTNAGPNENYARELFELHTLGAMNYQVPGGYVDTDVFESSRCFTGWTFEQRSSEPTRGLFRYIHEDHDRFIKFVLGTMIPNDQPPLKDGVDVLDMIAYHPGTARHIATKLCRRFIGDEPSAAVVQTVADRFYETRFEANQLLLTLAAVLYSDEFLNARVNKFKRPLDWCVSACRALGIEYSTNNNWNYLYDQLGSPLFSWPTPDGPGDTFDDWASSNGMLQRWNWIFQISSGWYESSNIVLNVDGILPPGVQTARQAAEFWAPYVLGRQPSAQFLNALMDFIADGRGFDQALTPDQLETKSRYGAALCCMSREFMRR